MEAREEDFTPLTPACAKIWEMESRVLGLFKMYQPRLFLVYLQSWFKVPKKILGLFKYLSPPFKESSSIYKQTLSLLMENESLDI